MSQLTSRGYLPTTPCKPKHKDLFALCEYVCLYIHSLAFAYMYITSWHHTIAFLITISRISRVLLMQGYVEPDVYQGARGFSSNQSKVQVQQLESVAMTHSTWWAWFSWKDIHRYKALQSKFKNNNSNQWLWPTQHGELDSRGKTSTGVEVSNPRAEFNL